MWVPARSFKFNRDESGKYKKYFSFECTEGCCVFVNVSKNTATELESETVKVQHCNECQNHGGFVIKKKCVCGAEKANTTHARWCDKYQEY